MARALREALRHDYGPERSKEFFDECETRIAEIGYALEAAQDMTSREVADHLRALASVGSRVALLERSRLGEYSWPFAEAITHIAERLFSNEEATGPQRPIVHVVAEGVGYHIWDDDPEQQFKRRIMVVAFPRHLRHHVLLHSIFGHELGHPALKSDETMGIIFGRIIPLMRKGALQDTVQLKRWMRAEQAPSQVKAAVGRGFEPSDDQVRDWRFELLCDLFGLVLFGPAFAAAHRMILEPLTAPEDYAIESATHPPYRLRKKLLADAMTLLHWMEPVIAATNTGGAEAGRAAEAALLAYAGGDAPDDWHRLIGIEDLEAILAALTEMFDRLPGLAYSRPDPEILRELLDRLAWCRPPIVQGLDPDDNPVNERVPIQHCLYAGWAFWFGRDALEAPRLDARPDMPSLNFHQVNRLCEQALLQQRAIDAVLGAAA